MDNARRSGVRRTANLRNLGSAAAVNQGMPVTWYDAIAKPASGHAIHKIGLEFHQFYWYRGFLRYSAKHFRAVQLKVICLAVLVGSDLRTEIVICRQKSLNPIAVISKVVRLAGCLNAVASAV